MKKNFTLLFVISMYFTSLIAQTVQVGSGSYTTQFPGVDEAGRNSYPSGTPYLSGEAASKPVPTNDWWSNLIKEAHGGQAFNYPLSYQSLTNGLVINYTMPVSGSTVEYRQPMSDVQGIVMGVSNLNAAQSTASDHSDWTATINWNDGSHDFSALMGHGMPFTYFTKGSSDVASVKIGFNLAGAYVNGNKLILENNYGGASYIVYAPSGSSWSLSGDTYTSTLNGRNYWSMVMIPFSMSVSEALTYFENYAFVFPAETQVDWNYNENTSLVKTNFTITPDVKEGSGNTVFWGILPHHWGNIASGSAQPSSISYNTVRGEMKMLTSNTFSTEIRFSGILPTLPDLGKYSDSFDPADITNKIKLMQNDGLPTWTDSYNEGQSMNRLVQTARIADQLGYTEARDQLLATVKERLEDWLTAESGEVAFLFYYNSDWKAMIGYPAGHRQDNNLNDHHFHWGYFIHAAAAIEQYYPGWASQWGDMIYMLIRDAANPSRTDSMFPFLRNYSPYAGHSWANGFASEPFGNDQESTSESMQFNSALIHWGSVIGNDAIRDLGIYLYTTEHSSVNEYWFDQNNRTFQPEYQYEMVARIWGAGYDNGTWWTTDVAASYGIQLYPIHGGSLYLGHNTAYVQEVWDGMKANTDILNNVANDNLWYDTYWKFLSFLDAPQALSLYQNYTNRNVKMGISDAHTYQWLHTMVALGQIAEEITADYPIACVFNKNGVKTYAAHNYTNSQITVHFSDGYNLNVPPRSRATSRDVDATISIQAGNVELPTNGSTTITASVSGSVSKVEFYKNGLLIGTDNTAPYSVNTGSLSAGFPGFYAKAYVGSEFNISNVVAIQVGSQLPYLGTPYAIPGTIETANYDIFEGGSGQGIAYSDNTTWNEGDYRTDEAVDAAVDANEGATVGWIEGGEWLEYTVNIQTSGNYKADIRYANGGTADGGPLYFKLDDVQVGSGITFPTTGDWGAWLTNTVENIPLSAGEHKLLLYAEQGGFNLGKIAFEYTGGSIPVLTSISVTPATATISEGATQQYTATGYDQDGNVMGISPSWTTTGGSISTSGLYSGSTAGDFTVTATSGTISGNASITVNPISTGKPIPGVIQAEDYDNMNGIDLETTTDTDGGQNVGWIDAGDWIEFDVEVATSGNYNLDYRVASESTGGDISISSDGTTIASDNFTSTGGWQIWETESLSLELSAGTQTIRVTAVTGGWNINWLEFTSEQTTPVTGVSISQTSISLEEGTTQQLSANVLPTNATNQNVSWSSNNSSVASVNSNGNVTAVNSGTATITVTTEDGGFTASCSVTVSIVPTGEDITDLGGTITSEFNDSPAAEGIENLIDNDVNTKYLTFNASAWVQYQAPSGYIVTSYTIASANDAAERDPLNWTLQGSNNGSSWTTMDSQSGVDFPDRYQTLSFEFSNATSFIYYRLNLNNNSGTLLQLAEIELFGTPGTTTIPVTGVSISQAGISLEEGNSQQLTANVLPVNATEQGISWTSSNSTVASVDQSGFVAASTAGTSTITATSTDGSYTATCTVTVTSTPITGVSIPALIQAEDYTAESGTDLETTTDIDGGQNVGWIDNGDWMEYEIYVPTAGAYTVDYRLASESAGGEISLTSDGSVIATTSFSATGGWQVWTTETSNISLESGSHTIRVTATTGGWNINWIDIKAVATPVLSSIVLTPATAVINIAETQQFVATGYDQNGNQMSISPNWSSTGGTISTSGLFTGITSGDFTITASAGTIQAYATISVNTQSTNCSVIASTGDYSAEVSNDASNPTITFVPEISGVGDNLVILYYGTAATGNLAGYIVSPNVPFQISASAGQQIYFYYTYSLPTGGENNTAGSRNDFIVGDCTQLKAAGSLAESESKHSINAYPNPVSTKLTVDLATTDYTYVAVYNLLGKVVYSSSINNDVTELNIDFEAYEKGVYTLVIANDNTSETIRILKQ